MLGQLIGEASGKVTGFRVVPTEGKPMEIEVSFQGSGKLLGIEITDVGRYRGTPLYGEGQALIMTRDGETAEWTGFGSVNRKALYLRLITMSVVPSGLLFSI
jgi:hypothetical protein